jgi:L,D-peptidoglycan transpeptidase YkuD (ErfK/YbiS/YcfS/YnhG family)
MTDFLVIAEGTTIHGRISGAGLSFPCVLGRSGARAGKHEGDGATPIGRYPLRRLLYRADRLKAPATKLPTDMIARDDGWCDEPSDPRYNMPVKLPYAASHEEMWREDGLYDLVVIVGYNDDPVAAGHGSAIFMHVRSPDGAPTAGCIALAKDDLLKVLAAADSSSTITIRPG